MATSKSNETPVKKTTAKKAAPKVVAEKPAKKTSAKTTTPKTTTRKKAATPVVITSEDRIKMIEVAAYYIAEQYGFSRNPADCWYQAEQEVDAKLNA